jgi:hypothetical protein
MIMYSINPFTAIAPSDKVTDKYKFISTAQFIQDVESLGYKLEETRQPRRGLGMHSMAFSHPTMPKVEGLDLRLLATNSHDATSAFRLHIQVGVGICANVLTAFIPDLAAHARVVHRGYALDKVQTAIDAVRNRVDFVLGNIDAMRSRDVTPENAAEFLKQAVELRDAKPYRILDLQVARHSPQAENTAWNVFNRVQESLIKGGYRTLETFTDHNGVSRQVPGRSAREITSVKDRVQTNYKLWELAVDTLLKA